VDLLGQEVTGHLVRQDPTQEDPHLVIMDLLLMDLTCLLQAAQAQAWAPLQCHLLVFLRDKDTLLAQELLLPVVTRAQVPHQTVYPHLPHPPQSMRAPPQLVIL